MDLINRQSALDAIRELEKHAPTAQHVSAMFDCEDIIATLPSAPPFGYVVFIIVWLTVLTVILILK